ncbi:hypothetical protein D3C81_856880 [compost metagenome]
MGFGAADPGRHGAGDLRFGQHGWAKTHPFGVGDGLELHVEGAIAGGAGGDLGDDRAGGEGFRRAVADFQYLAGGQGRTAAGAAEPGLVVEVALVAQAGVEVAAFALQVFVLVDAVAKHRVRLAVVVGLAVGGAGATGLVDLAVEPGASISVVVGAKVDGFFHHLVAGLQRPDAVLAAAAQAGLRAVRQAHVELVVALVIVEFHHGDLQAVVAGEAVPDADFGQQAGDEGQVAFAVLHDLLAAGVFADQVEEEILALEVVAAAQEMLDDLRHRLLLVDTKLPAAFEQGQARPYGDFIAGFIDGVGQALEAGDHAIEGAQRLDLGHGQAQVGQVLWRRVQAEMGFAAKQLVGGEILFRRGELDAVGEGLAEGFFAVEGQDVEGGVEPAQLELVVAVVEVGAEFVVHSMAPQKQWVASVQR